MKKLTRLLLIHWFNFDHEIIDFDTVNFLTGKNGTGKSVIIDALQVVLMGETKSTIFNKAANKDSHRNLQSYLYGELGDDGDSSYRYIRSGQTFTSYIAAEFFDTVRNKYFTDIFVADCYTDNSEPFKKWVILNEPIPDEHFIDPVRKSSYSFNQLRGYLKNTYGQNSFQVYDTNNAYQQAILGKYGQVKKKYLTLLKNAVPFNPVYDITAFITDSICDVKEKIDLDEMQSDIRQYQSLEQEVARINDRIEKLQNIQKASDACANLKRKRIEQQYIVDRADLQENEDKKEALLTRQKECAEEIETLNSELKSNLENKKIAENKKRELENKRATSDIGKMQDSLQAEIARLDEQIQNLTETEVRAFKRLNSSGNEWLDIIQSLITLGFHTEDNEIAMARQIAETNVNNIKKLDFDNLYILGDLKQRITEEKIRLSAEKEAAQKDLAAKEKQILDLRKGIKPYPETVNALSRLIERELLNEKNVIVKVSILADCLEIKDQSWRNAIEGYLDYQKFYLLVPQEYYNDALHIYENAKKELNLYNVGLIDIAKLRENYHENIKKNSLAEEIESDNEDALLYADYLLQDVIKCDSVDELNQYKIGITKTCMLYKNYVSRKLSPKRYANPFIGRRSMEQLLENLKKEADIERKEIEKCQSSINQYSRTDKIEAINSNESLRIKDDTSKHSTIVQKQSRRDEAEKELAGLNLTFILELDKQIAELETQCSQSTNKISTLERTIGSKEQEKSIINDESLPDVMQIIAEKQKNLQATYHEEWIQEIGEQKYLEAYKAERSLSLKVSYQRTLEASKTTLDNTEKERNRLRQNYVTKYKLSFAVDGDDNQEYEKDMSNLQTIALPDYLTKITDAKEKSFRKFRDDFIAKLKSNIETVKGQIDELNSALRAFRFGTDRYRFTVSPRSEYESYYKMIMDDMLMQEGYNLMSDSFNDRYSTLIQEMFDKLTQNETYDSSDKKKNDKKQLDLTDYRTYLTFDMIVTGSDGQDQRLSKTMSKKSGGETQIPFYISLLASIAQVCNVKYKSRNNTIRMIMMDEAFSKMDGERIRECIPLLRKFELQAIFSAPPEKAGDIATLVDRNIAVIKDSNNHSFTKCYDPKQVNEELSEEEDS
ncbi:MAG: hypothetical protein GX478_10305 [Erysipelotrichaceae bacterium]|jgi:uncharacterized protein YPO0396|nr:hypothetical protein [Erysipelotrichaceae bacterium]